MNASTNASVAAILSEVAAKTPRYNNLTIIDFTSNLSVLAYDPSITNLTNLSPALNSLLAPELFSAPTLCVYPISGNYGFLNRLLFYCLLIFALLSRWHTWLCPAALGIVMIYSSTAAVHAFALLLRYQYNGFGPDFVDHLDDPKYYGDVDLFGIFPILVSAAIMLAPIMNWSYALRKEENHNARPLVILWGLLIFTALVPTMVRVANAWPFFMAAVTTCTINEAKGCNFQTLAGDFGFSLFQDVYDRCDCMDTCGMIREKEVPFRRSQQLQALLVSRKAFSLVEKKGVNWIYVADFVWLAVIVVHGAFSLLEIHWTQAELRNKLFLKLAGGQDLQARTFRSKSRYFAAKTATSLLYLLSVFMAVLAPMVFVLSVIINEFETWPWPTTAADDAGEWGPWVGAVFALMAAITQEYWPQWQNFLNLGVRTAFGFVKRDRDRAVEKVYRKEHNTEHSIMANIRAFFQALMRPLRWFIHATSELFGRIKMELRDFGHWFKDPISVSKQASQTWNPSRVEFHDSGDDEDGDVADAGSSHHLPKNVSRVEYNFVNSRWESSDSFPKLSPHGGIQHAQTAPSGSSQHIPLLTIHPPKAYHKPSSSDHDDTAYHSAHQTREPRTSLRPTYQRRNTDSPRPDESSPPLRPSVYQSQSQRPLIGSPQSSNHTGHSRESPAADKELPAIPHAAARGAYRPVADDDDLS